jgi:DNA-binding transcriptional regulator GbsR (MarR family)
MDLTKEVKKTAICSGETYFKSYRSLYERPAFRETLDCVDCTIYCLLADRYNFFASLEHHENQVKTRSGELAIRYSESKIAEYLQVSRYKVSLAIQKLEILGLIKVERTPGQASNYVVFDIPAEVPQERVAKVKKLLGEKKQRNKKYNNKDLLNFKQELAQNRASDDLLHIEQVVPAQNRAGNDDDLLKMNTGTCSKLSNHLLKIEQVPAQNEYNNKTYKEKDLIKNPERGTASPEGSACPPAVINQDNDGIQGEVATISGEGFSLPETKKDNAVSIDMMSSSEQDTMLLPGNTIQQTNDGINQQLQDPIIPASQNIEAHMHNATNNIPGVQIEQRAASSQNLPEGRITLREWLAANCKVQWVIDHVLNKLDGDQIMPDEEDYLNGWGDMMADIAAALPTLRDVLVKCGVHPDNITTLERLYRDKNTPLTASTVIGTLCGPSATDKLMVYILTDDYAKYKY